MASNDFTSAQTNGTAGAAPVNGHATHAGGATERIQVVDDEKQFTYTFSCSICFKVCY